MAVTGLEIKTSSLLACGLAFGDVGPYEQLDGTVHFGAEPDNPRNELITDLKLAPRDAGGLVSFSADFCILRPAEPQRGNHRILLDVPNRGRKLASWLFNRAPMPQDFSAPLDPGDGFLMRQGYTLVWCGWQYDLPSVTGLMGMKVPDAFNLEVPISGKILVNFQPNAPAQVQMLSDRMHRTYSSNDTSDPEANLLVRDHEDAPPDTIPRDRWSFARLEDGRVVPDASHIYMASGFSPGKVYQIVYSTTGAPVVGLGLLATRDMASFLRYGPAREGNPCAGDVQYAYGFGASQSGRFLRQFLYLGLNEDEDERQVFDGLICHIGGGTRGGFNQRFGQPSSSAQVNTGNHFPFTDREQTDPETGGTDGLLSKLAARGKEPKIFFTNSSAEYWRGHASLIHTDVEGERDVAPLETVRIYHYAGTQHGPGLFPPTDTNPDDGTHGQQLFNSVDYTPLLRAALLRLDRWVTSKDAPPPSRHLRIDDGTAVPAGSTTDTFKTLPGVSFPAHLLHISRLDFGPETEAGMATTLPPVVGKPYPSLVSAVDEDGNELGGIRLPDISVPLATYTGWNLRHPDMGAPEQLMGLPGSTIPFAPTKAERDASGDPRLSIEERYASREAFLEQVRGAARELVREGYMLEEDVDLVVEHSARRYDEFTRQE